MSSDQSAPRPLAAAHDAACSAEETRVLQAVLSALRRIRFGSIQVVVQDGKVVQIDTTEKTRLGT